MKYSCIGRAVFALIDLQFVQAVCVADLLAMQFFFSVFTYTYTKARCSVRQMATRAYGGSPDLYSYQAEECLRWINGNSVPDRRYPWPRLKLDKGSFGLTAMLPDSFVNMRAQIDWLCMFISVRICSRQTPLVTLIFPDEQLLSRLKSNLLNPFFCPMRDGELSGHVSNMS